MAEVIERVSALEAALMKLAYAQFNTEMELQGLSKKLDAFPVEMKEFKDEMKEFKDETRRANREMNKRWGEIANKLGTVVEDIVYPNIARLAIKHFGATQLEFIGARIKRRHKTRHEELREFDVIAAWEDCLLLVEAKASLRPEYFQAFAAFVREARVFEYFTEYTGRRVIPVFAALSIPASDVAFLTRERIYALGMGDDTMELLNRAELEGTVHSPRPLAGEGLGVRVVDSTTDPLLTRSPLAEGEGRE